MERAIDHHSKEVIARDYELSERLGAEIIAGEYLPVHDVKRASPQTTISWVRTFSARAGVVVVRDELVVTEEW